MRRLGAVATCIAGVCAGPGAAWSANGTYALVGGTVHPVRGAAMADATVIVRGDRIVAVGKDLPLPEAATVIDCRGKTVTPGLIEASSQLGLVEIWQVEGTNDTSYDSPDPIRAAVRAQDAVDPRSLLVGVARRRGITSVVATPVGGLISGQSAWLDLLHRGSAQWPTAASGPIAMHATLGEAGAAEIGGSRASALMRLREVLDDARVFRADRRAYDRNALRRLATSRLDLEALQAVLTRRLPLLVGVHRAADILAVLDLARSMRIDVALVGAAEGWLVAEQIAAAKVPVIVYALDNLPRRFERRGARADNVVLLAKAGVKVAISTGSSHNAGALRFVLGNAVRAGLPRDLALAAATLHPAQIFRQDRRYGSVEVGRTANLVVWSGDPFDPSGWPETVFVRGQIQPLDNRQTRLRDRYKTRLGL